MDRSAELLGAAAAAILLTAAGAVAQETTTDAAADTAGRPAAERWSREPGAFLADRVDLLLDQNEAAIHRARAWLERARRRGGHGTARRRPDFGPPDALRFVVLDTARTELVWSGVPGAEGYSYSSTVGDGVARDTSVVLPLRALDVACVRARRSSPRPTYSDSTCARVATGPETRIRFVSDSLFLFPRSTVFAAGTTGGFDLAVALYRDSARSEMIGCQGDGCWRLADRIRPAVLDVRGRDYYLTWPDSTRSASWVLRPVSDLTAVPEETLVILPW